jgi:hypothetical protein
MLKKLPKFGKQLNKAPMQIIPAEDKIKNLLKVKYPF